jgi:hypothetical protein
MKNYGITVYTLAFLLLNITIYTNLLNTEEGYVFFKLQEN